MSYQGLDPTLEDGLSTPDGLDTLDGPGVWIPGMDS